MSNPIVTVTKLDKRPNGSGDPTANLGVSSTLNQVVVQLTTNQLLKKMAEAAKEFFLLEWVGSKIPRGAVISGHTVVWTQNGVVTAEGGGIIGTYHRVVECGGPSGQDQKMLVFLS